MQMKSFMRQRECPFVHQTLSVIDGRLGEQKRDDIERRKRSQEQQCCCGVVSVLIKADEWPFANHARQKSSSPLFQLKFEFGDLTI